MVYNEAVINCGCDEWCGGITIVLLMTSSEIEIAEGPHVHNAVPSGCFIRQIYRKSNYPGQGSLLIHVNGHLMFI